MTLDQLMRAGADVPEIGRIVGLSQPTVGKVRKKLEQQGDAKKFITSTDTLGRKQPRKRAIAGSATIYGGHKNRKT
jgi:hypothetical protein